MACEMGKIKVIMKKPVYIGQVILDVSKIIIYEVHYDYMKPKFKDFCGAGPNRWVGCRCQDLQLSYMDMDSLVYSIKTEDFLTNIADDVPRRFDIPDRPLPIGLNKKVIGLMKDELGGAIMTKFITLRPKLCSYRVLDGPENKTCKGIKKCIVKKTLTFEDYKACLFNSDMTYRSQLMFRSIKHEIFTLEVNRVALNRDDDKRISKRDGISTLAHGHKSLSWIPILGEVSLR